MRNWIFLLVVAGAIPVCVGCSSEPNNPNSPSGGGPACTASAIPCEDDVVQQLNFKANIAPGLISDVPDGSGYVSTIDATAGGYNYTDSYVYAKFTDKGLVKVDLQDEASLSSMEWDIAFRRFVIRINSANSGPSCVMAARLKTGTTYDSVQAIPADANFVPDEYFSGTCMVIPEGSGLGSPATALSGFWKYDACVQMTGNVYIVKKLDGKSVKITVTDYYEPTLQEQCNMTGAVPMGTPGAMIRMRWALLP